MKKNILFKNSITKSFNNKSLHSKSKKNLNNILKKVFGTLDIKKDTLHVLSKKLDLDFNLSELKIHQLLPFFHFLKSFPPHLNWNNYLK